MYDGDVGEGSYPNVCGSYSETYMQPRDSGSHLPFGSPTYLKNRQCYIFKTANLPLFNRQSYRMQFSRHSDWKMSSRNLNVGGGG